MKQDKRNALVLRWAEEARPYVYTYEGYVDLFEQILNEYEQIEKEDDIPVWYIVLGATIGIGGMWALMVTDWSQGIIHAMAGWI